MQQLLPPTINNQNNKCSRRGSQLKPKELKISNKKNVYKIRSLKLLNSYDIMGLKTNLLPSMNVHCKVIRLDCLIILPQFNQLKEIKLVKRTSNLPFQNKLLQKKTLKPILKDISKQVLGTKYTLNLGQLLWAILNIKRYLFNPVPLKPTLLELAIASIAIDHQMAVI